MEVIEIKLNDTVILNRDLPYLKIGTIGIVTKIINNDTCSVTYPQNSAYKLDSNGNWVEIKGKPIQVYAHSAKFRELLKASA